jgi:hypothetical protein
MDTSMNVCYGDSSSWWLVSGKDGRRCWPATSTTSTVPRRFVMARLAAACAERPARPNSPPLPAAAVTPDYLTEPAELSWQSR